MAGDWGTGSQERAFVVEVTAAVAISAVPVPVSVRKLEARCAQGTVLTFSAPLGKQFTVASDAAQGAVSVQAAAVPVALIPGDAAVFVTGSFPGPKIWVDSNFSGDPPGRVRGSHGNDLLDQQAYLAGMQAPSLTYIEVTATAPADTSIIPIKKLKTAITAADLPLTLFFTPGDGKYALITLPHLINVTELNCEPIPTTLALNDKAPWPQQPVTEIDADIYEAPSVGGVAQLQRFDYFNRVFSGSSALFRFFAEVIGTLGAADYADFLLGFRKAGGDEGDTEPLAKFHARRDGTDHTASVDVFVADSGAFLATPAATFRYTGRTAFGMVVPNWTVEIEGDIDLRGTEFRYIGAQFWRENPAGTLTHTGSAIITGQLRSTAADGTAPLIVASNAKMIRNLNVPNLSDVNGDPKQWPIAGLEDGSTDDIETPLTPYNLGGTVAADEDGLFAVIGAAVIEVDVDDEGATFSATATGAQSPGSSKFPTGSAGWKSQIISFGLADLNNADPIVVEVEKNAKTGASTGIGKLNTFRYGFGV